MYDFQSLVVAIWLQLVDMPFKLATTILSMICKRTQIILFLCLEGRKRPFGCLLLPKFFHYARNEKKHLVKLFQLEKEGSHVFCVCGAWVYAARLGKGHHSLSYQTYVMLEASARTNIVSFAYGTWLGRMMGVTEPDAGKGVDCKVETVMHKWMMLKITVHSYWS